MILCSRICVFLSLVGYLYQSKNEDAINDNQIVEYSHKIVIMSALTEHLIMFLAVSCMI